MKPSTPLQALSIFNPERATGPIFTKELRVASRRRRNYWLRVGYIALMLLVLAVVAGRWGESGDGGADQTYEQARQGKMIISVVAWVQFVALQLVAVVLASSAVNEEVYSRSLGVLMTTPITSLQIVLGKLLSKMLQILQLILISLPAMAILRVYGGVPWDFLLAGTCVTLTACLFAAAVAMFFSVFIRRAWAVTLLTLASLMFLYAIISWMLTMVVGILMLVAKVGGAGSGVGDIALVFVKAVNPFVVMGFLTADMWNPSGVTMSWWGSMSWGIHCLIMIGISAGLVAITVPMVRRTALRTAIGGTPRIEVPIPRRPMPPVAIPSPTSGPAVAAAGDSPTAGQQAATYWQTLEARSLRTVSDRPVLWRELSLPLIHNRTVRWVLMIIVLVILGLLYAGMITLMLGFGSHVDPEGINLPFILLYAFCGLGCTVIVSTTGIASEREAGTLSLLMATPLSANAILWGKAAGALRRTLPIWLFLLANCVVFSVFRTLSPIVILHMLLLVVGTSAFLTGTGLYFSARFRKTTSAAIVNLGMAIGLWGVLPLLAGILDVFGDASAVVVDINPLYLAYMLTSGACLDFVYGTTHEYYWAGMHNLGVMETTNLLLAIVGGYALVGWLCMLAARRHMRRNMFA
jgi:ABC-type transport system involved in multi-copper enzyme maturation permease subunit